MKLHLFLIACTFLSLSASAQSRPSSGRKDALPFKRDCTGIDWALPFDSALERASKSNRILLIKPIAFGTDRNGCW